MRRRPSSFLHRSSAFAVAALCACGPTGATERPAPAPAPAAAADAVDPSAAPAPAPAQHAERGVTQGTLLASAPATQPVPTANPEVADAPERSRGAAGAVTPLSAEARALFWGSAQGKPPAEFGGVTKDRRDKHYLAGNEKTLDAFYPEIRGLGGGYVGVGSDQAYLFIGWQQPEFAWLTDYDPEVVGVHGVYAAFFAAAATPAEFLALWQPEAKAAALAAIDAHCQATPAAERAASCTTQRAIYVNHRGWIARRLRLVTARMRQADVPCYLTDASQYADVRARLAAGRVRPLLANLIEGPGFRGVAETARTLGVPIRVIYLSNAEEYWNVYPRKFRDHLLALEGDDRSVVLRTLLTWDVNMDYRYVLQSLANFHAHLREPAIRSVYQMAHDRPKMIRDQVNVYRIAGEPAAAPAVRRAAEPPANPAPRG